MVGGTTRPRTRWGVVAEGRKDVSDGLVEAVPNDSRFPAGVGAGVACEEAEAWAEKVPGALCILANVNA